MNRETMATKMSSLTLGTGKVIRFDNIDKLELHLDTNDYSSLITQRLRPSNSFSVIRQDKTNRTVPTKLPKTFVTRSGSLFLYSDSKIMKDNVEQFPVLTETEPFCVHGAKMSTASQNNKTAWKKYVSSSPRLLNELAPKVPLGSEERRNKNKYIRNLNRSAKDRPKRKSYSWNYAITPVKISEANQEISIETVKELSQALLGYRLGQISDRERYENTVMNAWRWPTGNNETQKNIPRDITSAWTLEWLRSPRRMSYTTDSPINHAKTSKDHFLMLQKARTDLSLANKGIVPTNTPYSLDDRKGLGTRAQSRLSTHVRTNKLEPSLFWVPPEKRERYTDISNTPNMSDRFSDACSLTPDI